MSGKLQVKPLLAKSHLAGQHSIIANGKQSLGSYHYDL